MTSDTPGSGEPRPRDPEPASPDPGAVTAAYTPPEASASTAPPDAVPPPAPPPPGGTGLLPDVGWARPVRIGQEVAPGLVFSNMGARFVAWIIDILIVGVLFAIIGSVLEAVGLRSSAPSTASLGDAGYWDAYVRADPVGAVLGVGLSAIYFIGSWSGGRRATLGQRLLSIQVGNAFDGRALSLEQAIRRWLGLGEFLSLLGVVAVLAGLGNLLYFVWSIVLLITTATSPTKQGLHDKLANTAVVRPASAGNGWVTGCLVIVLILALVTLLSIVALIFLGGQVSDILSNVGESV